MKTIKKVYLTIGRVFPETFEEKAIYETIYKWTCVELPIVNALES